MSSKPPQHKVLIRCAELVLNFTSSTAIEKGVMRAVVRCARTSRNVRVDCQREQSCHYLNRIMKVAPKSRGWPCLWLLAGSAILSTAAVNCPAITKGPSDVVAYFCDFVTFAAEATGTLPLHYQWYRDGAPISNATNSIYITARPAAS